MKIPECDRCILYARNPHLVCAVHPDGVETNSCIDFRPNSNIEEEEQWSVEGYSYYDGQLIRDRSRYTRTEQWEILNTHPFFAGVCPQCGYRFNNNNTPQVHWDCPSCGWIDDSV
jgi:predicted RNA-binding Zn-ribbon protein involved in translation (DUF1610 family)